MVNKLWVRSIMEGSQQYIYILDKNGKILECSDNVLASFNKRKDEVIQRYISDFLDFNEFYLEDGKSLKEENNPLYNIINHNLSTRKRMVVKYLNKTYNLDVVSLSEDGVEIEGISVIFNDVTNYKNKMEKKLKERQNLELLNTELQCKCDVIDTLRAKEKQHLLNLNDILKNISEGILVMPNIEKTNFCNSSFYDILGITNLDIENKRKNLDKYIVIRDDNKSYNIRQFIEMYILENKKVVRDIVAYVNPQNKKGKYLEFNVNPVYNSNNKFRYMIITVKDITEIKQHEKKLENARVLMERMVYTIDVPMAILDYPSFYVKLENEDFEKMAQCILKEENTTILNNYFLDIIRNDIKEEFLNILDKVIKENKEEIINNFKIKDKNGENKFYKIKISPYLDESDGIKHICIYGIDITDEVNTNIKLQNMTKIKDDFFAITSHELRTPLAIMSSSIQLAKNIYGKEIGPNIDRTLSTINNNCSKLLKLINNILDISKAEAGFMEVNNSVFDLIDTTNYIVDSVKSYATSKGLSVQFYCSLNKYFVNLDKDKYEKVMLNLLSNAIKYTPEGGNIHVFLNLDNKHLSISVSDEGVGIPEDKIATIFDRYTRVNNKMSNKSSGTGIGLSLVKKLVEIMSGNIYLDSMENEGSTFTIEFIRENIERDEGEFKNCQLDNIKNKVEVEFSDI
ncbi:MULTISPECIES: PAS domain-containing sensor histidine kinase [Clostridium]|uniref:histidine kinase n=1 Tax=Clostridium cadaveris TaxID=1529 RepID=A0A1I2JMJ9_9CLOT|nr:PAS domain-containing sensor histidine kinase [Clostridium cadaveris]MDU4951266.1 PAS domain-containing sensor histidine kinase [Clostridium sp.]MDM8313120.1 PAS domain-containing sensor histidine kinase [Clostridium cadaveris]MDY4947867.1 PAS domain-containing sensor histidine kinase [Clostridium cadaveris]NME63890.1 PAS domain-containing sensor histidine kinase [Clostridium cadaveris]NWK10497.1 PAS domain-containing sensor histidine kinase [Clostridium cadaveris]